mgnify:CR=1 FL=1
MSKRIANQEVKEALMIGYDHYSRKYEKTFFEELLKGEIVDRKNYEKPEQFPLADNNIRNIKNGLICCVAIVCRAAADLGADDHKCYALSDYYINEIERKKNTCDWEAFLNEIFSHYRELVSESQTQSYSLPVTRAVKFIRQHIYEKCSLKRVADAIAVHPNYLSARFKKETGTTVTSYILNEKMAEAKSLLENTDRSISEITALLSFESVSYFTKQFRRNYGCTPSEFRRM